MQTHYVRLKAPFHSHVSSAIESLVCQAVPQDHLAIISQVMEEVVQLAFKQGETTPTPKIVVSFLKTLVQKGFVREVYGPRLEKWLATL